MLIFKILRADEWTQLLSEGRTAGAAVDLADGFIHFSDAEQVLETAAKHFAGVEGLRLLAVDAAGLGAALKWEAARKGGLFPHLYRDLYLDDIAWHRPLPLCDGKHHFGDLT